LIDDDEDDCYLFHRAVSEISNDLVVNCAYSSDNLLKVLESAQPSIIFIDLHLPKQNGLACLRQIRSIPSLEHIPVIFWSGSCDAKIVTSAYHEGAQYYFEKPCCIKELEEELKNILYTHQGVNNTVYSASDEKLLPTF
jgi:CheY-like chemotaxis protein